MAIILTISNMRFSLIVLLIQIGTCLVSGSEWTYSQQELWPSICNGNAQSPIAISDDHTIPISLDDFEFSQSYFEVNQANLTNTGHSVEIKIINSKYPLTIRGGGLNNEYVLASFHFHWGSEHVVNDYRYPLEGHFVHYNSQYGDITNALNYKDGIAVLGVFYELSEKCSQVFGVISPVIPRVARLINTPESLGKSVRLADFLPGDTRGFYRYLGSLTTPDCNEVVTWTLFTTPSYISDKQVDTFTKIRSDDNKRLLVNYRELQDASGRDIYYIRS